ncbi:hypothetical protein DXD08_14355 [Lachnospiraceae bacterium TF10-8AT]|nr:hypothetical protein DXD08_14355 [Lachnospiraceae bacterium TF10-8AT]
MNTLEGEFARNAGGSAICKKREQNSLAALPIVYLFFIIYSKSTVGQLQIKILRQQHSIVCEFSAAGFFEFLQ